MEAAEARIELAERLLDGRGIGRGPDEGERIPFASWPWTIRLSNSIWPCGS